MNRPHHLHLPLIGLVALGGTIGTAGRYLLTGRFPTGEGIPVGTLLENLTGAFLLGLLLESLIRAGQENRGRRVLRLGLGTGVLGGFTTYSTLALEVQNLFASHQPALALAYGVGSVLVGFMACLLGIFLAASLARRRRPL